MGAQFFNKGVYVLSYFKLQKEPRYLCCGIYNVVIVPHDKRVSIPLCYHLITAASEQYNELEAEHYVLSTHCKKYSGPQLVKN